MLLHKRFSISPILFILVALALALIFSCSEQPTAIDKESGNGLEGSGEIDPGASGRFLLGEVSDTSLGPGTLQIWAKNVVFHDSTGMTTFDVQLLNLTQLPHYLPIRFIIRSIVPDDIAVVDFDGEWGGDPFYNFSEQLGGGDVLQPGALTEPVTMKFHTVTARSFAIGFRLALGPASGTGTVGGGVFLSYSYRYDEDFCFRCYPGIPGITVALEKQLYGGGYVTLLAVTDSNGEYSFAGLGEGIYKVYPVIAPESVWKIVSPNPLLVTLVKGPDGKVQDFLEANFYLFPVVPPNPNVNLFGPIVIGPPTPFGTELDSTFVNPPSPLTVVFKYWLVVDVQPMGPWGFGVVDSADAWINGEMVFTYRRPNPEDTIWVPYRFERQVVQLPDSLVRTGENTIRLITDGEEWAALKWLVLRQP